MKNPLVNLLSGFATIGIVVAAVLLASGSPEPPAPPTGEPGLVETIETSGPQTEAEALAPQHKSRRVRASLGMPYFSFAQSLRPRG